MLPIPYATFCSGIEAVSAAVADDDDWSLQFVSEIEPWPCAHLALHYEASEPVMLPPIYTAQQVAKARKVFKHVTWGDRIVNHGDFTQISDGDMARVAVVVAGTPCQAFSFAGQRRSLDDARGNLTLSFVDRVHAAKSLFCALWENVPGVLSTRDNAFGCLLGALVGSDDALCVPGGGRWPDTGMVAGPAGRAAWRVLDAQYFGVPQRRRRVFLVFCPAASAGDPAAILFERQGLPWDFAAGGQAGEDVAGTSDARASGGGGLGTDFDVAGGLQVAPTLLASYGDKQGLDDQHIGGGLDYLSLAACLTTKTRFDAKSETLIPMTGGGFDVADLANTLRSEGFDASEDGTGRANLIPVAFTSNDYGADSAYGVAPTLRAGGHGQSHANSGVVPAIAFALRGREDGAQVEISGDRVGALRAGSGGSSRDYVAMAGVRRLTPIECERLQGFPDNYTAETAFRTRQAADGPRYKALGNSMAVPVMRWIMGRIKQDYQAAMAASEAA